jgi:hypothetical protein
LWDAVAELEFGCSSRSRIASITLRCAASTYITQQQQQQQLLQQKIR